MHREPVPAEYIGPNHNIATNRATKPSKHFNKTRWPRIYLYTLCFAICDCIKICVHTARYPLVCVYIYICIVLRSVLRHIITPASRFTNLFYTLRIVCVTCELHCVTRTARAELSWADHRGGLFGKASRICKAEFKACALRIICWRRYDHNNGLRRRCGSKQFFFIFINYLLFFAWSVRRRWRAMC